MIRVRVVKDADERKNEILDVAEKLFATKGFDQTSTNDILIEVGIARGTLYYHFKSKEDILDGIIERMTRQLMAKASDIAVNREIPVLQRITLTIMALNVESDIGYEVMEQAHRPQNALMHQKMQEQILDEVNPLITRLLKEGIEQGICQTDYPAETVEMVMLYSNTAFDTLAEQSEEDRQRRIAAFIYNLERLLGMEHGTMQEAIMPIFKNSHL